MTEEEGEDVRKGRCAKCGHEWEVPVSDWLIFSIGTGKMPHCPKCGHGRIFWKLGKHEKRQA